ncbi:ATP-grasp domain-containing protein [Actinocorallia sp. A-T 12471]|uniref:D-alanine--D-alanine ligase family protein n=1 Tax=Actinocorallia sp. A-T 12471 TaxID=3089813 RepID=UPI0029D349EE|nr:ATP-grasp domain-containing protein [Actinocorallia sp. A-T 12471]MDX6739199.1 ATP-grasp domain-containing protein [Actinocorallia sp. A-T 12471]
MPRPLIETSDDTTIQNQLDLLRTWHQQMNSDLSVALVYGGVSEEDRLYLKESPAEQISVTALASSLEHLGIRFEILDPCEERYVASLTRFDVVLSSLHGPYGEDGRLQGLLDYLRKPYCGSGVAASAVAADKLLCKQTMRGLSVPTPHWWLWNDETVQWTSRPVMVKPTLGGSSVGMSLVHSYDELRPALEKAAAIDGQVMVEDYVFGSPVTVGLLELPDGLLVLPPLAIDVPDADFYDADTKLDADRTSTVSFRRADLSRTMITRLEHYAVRLWDGLGCQGSARIDFMVADNAEPQALEVNTNPGMSTGSNFVTAAELCGIGHADIVLALLHEALTRPPYHGPLPEPFFEAVSG